MEKTGEEEGEDGEDWGGGWKDGQDWGGGGRMEKTGEDGETREEGEWEKLGRR